MVRESLTSRQQDILDYITDRIKSDVPPTIREIGLRFGISSPNGVESQLKALEKKGAINRVPNVARNIRIGTDDNSLEKRMARLLRQIVDLGCLPVDSYTERYGDLDDHEGGIPSKWITEAVEILHQVER